MNKEIKCDYCEKTFEYYGNYKRHLRMKHE